MAELSKDIAKALGEFLSALPKPPKDGVTEEFKKAVKKQKAIRDAAHKTKTHTHYIVGREGGFVGGRMYGPGELVTLPHGKLPSKTWKPATARGVALAEELAAKAAAEAEELAGSAAEDDALEQDELDTSADSDVDEDDGDEDVETAEADDVDDAAPTPPPAKPKAKAPAAKPKAKAPAAKPKAGKASKPGRPNDQDVA